MSKQDDLKNKFQNQTQGEKSEDPRIALLGLNGGKGQAAATNENQSESQTQDINIAAATASGHFSEDTPKPAKKLKGIYLDVDVLAIYEAEAKNRDRGWGSKLTSDLLRAVFEKEGLFQKHKDIL